MPVPAPTLATELLLLDHAPLIDVLLRVVVAPWHTFITPVIAAGIGLPVSTADVAQHVASTVYNMFVVPTLTPDSTPDDRPIGAPDGIVLLHMPPGVASS